MKIVVTCLIACTLCLTALADIPRVYHVIKARIKTSDSTFTTYAVIEGELLYDDSQLKAYKADAKFFTQTVNQVMIHSDTLNLYTRIFRVHEQIVLLPEDTHTKILRKEIKEMVLLQYIPAEYTHKLIYTDIMSADSTWLSWKVAQVENFSDEPNGMCYYTALFFNKPDNNSKQILERAKAVLSKLNLEGVPKHELARTRRMLRKARIVVYGMCTC